MKFIQSLLWDIWKQIIWITNLCVTNAYLNKKTVMIFYIYYQFGVLFDSQPYLPSQSYP